MNPESIVGKKPFKPQESWKEAAENVKSIHDIYDIDASDSQHIEQMKLLILKKSFFLPREVLAAEDVKVSQLVIMCEKDFFNFWYSLSNRTDDICVSYEVDIQLLLRAKNVGVSARCYQDRTFIVCKVWYGGHANTDSSKDAQAAFRLKKLRQFCGLS